MSTHHLDNSKVSIPQEIILVPKVRGYFIFLVLLALPGFLINLVWLAFIAIVVIGFLVGLAGAGSNVNNSNLNLEVLEDSKNSEMVLIYNLEGPITSSDTVAQPAISLPIIRQDFQEIKDNDDIKAVVFRLNTPGGEVFASHELGDEIAALVDDKNQSEAVFYFDQVVASGGLLASYKSQNNYVFANQYGETGSIGVFAAIPNLKEAADNIGYKEYLLKSGELKGAGSLFQELEPAQIEYYQTTVDKHFSDFKNVVTEGRGIPSDEVDAFATGEVFFNDKAQELKLIDEINVIDAAVKKVAEDKNLGKDYKIVENKPEVPLIDSLFGVGSVERLFQTNLSNQVLERSSLLKPGRVYALEESLID